MESELEQIAKTFVFAKFVNFTLKIVAVLTFIFITACSVKGFTDWTGLVYFGTFSIGIVKYQEAVQRVGFDSDIRMGTSIILMAFWIKLMGYESIPFLR